MNKKKKWTKGDQGKHKRSWDIGISRLHKNQQAFEKTLIKIHSNYKPRESIERYTIKNERIQDK